jgi:hypothetical protein
MIIKNVKKYDDYSWKNILLLKFKFLMTKILEEDLEHQIINQLPELNLLFVPCPWDLIKVGIKFNLIFPILHAGPMEPTILKLLELPFMPIVELEESIFQIDYIANNNFHHNSNSSFLSKNNNDTTYHYWLLKYSLI